MSRYAECLAIVQSTPMAQAAQPVPKRHTAAPILRTVCCPDRATPCASVELETISARRVDMHALRRAFPERWGHFCRTHFRNSIELAAFFGTDERTARFWMEGKHAPASPFALRAVTAFPDAIPCLMEGDC